MNAEHPGRRLPPRLVEVAAVVCILGAFVAYVAPTLDRPLLEKHAWRQTQTAYAARIFHEERVDLLRPEVPVFGEPFDLPFEFPLFQAIAWVPLELGVEDDLAMRLTALACFLATALLLYGLVRRLVGPSGALGALTAFVMTPFSLVWARASLIEYLATAGAVGFAWAVIAWRDKPRPVTAALALAGGLVGMLVKPTTAIFWLLPAFAYRPEESSDARRRTRLVTAALALVPFGAAVLWTRHADAVKAATSTTAFLTSSSLQDWNFGTLSQRLDPDVWAVILKRLGPTVVGLYGLLLVVAVVATARAAQRRFWLAVWLAAFGPFLVFTNLYFQHDYYLAAVTPAFAALAGLGTSYVASLARRAPRTVTVAGGVLAALVLAYGSLELGRGYWLRIHGAEDDPQVLPLAAEAASLTRPDELVAMAGLTWSPAISYYARRKSHMIIRENEPRAWDLIREAGYTYLLVGDPETIDHAPLARWRWLGSLAPHSYALADTPRGLRTAEFVATDEPGPSRPVIGRGVRLRCDAPTALPAGRRGTWIRPRELQPAARLAVGDLAPLPLRRALYASPQLARDGRLPVSCTGARSLTFDLVDAPGPGD